MGYWHSLIKAAAANRQIRDGILYSKFAASCWLEVSSLAQVHQWLCGTVPDLQSGGCRFESQPGLLRTKVYSAFHPSGVGKWVPVIAGKAKAGIAHSSCGWTCGCAGKTVRSLENTCHTWALLRWWFTAKRRNIKCMHLYLKCLHLYSTATALPMTKAVHTIRLPFDSHSTATQPRYDYVRNDLHYDRRPTYVGCYSAT